MSWQVIRPTGANVLVKLHDRKATAGLLLIPDDHREQPVLATVIAVGPGRIDKRNGMRVPVDVQVGDVVMVGKYNGTALHDPEGDYDPREPRYWMMDCDDLKRPAGIIDIYGVVVEP